MILTEMLTITILWNPVAVVATALLPVAMLGLPVMRAMLLPHLPLLTLLHALRLL